jgi:hypothetical protein
VAAHAGAENVGMIDAGSGPAGRGVAIATQIICCNVVGGLAGGRGAVMAAHAGSGDGTVIEASRQPGHGCVAAVTLCRGRDVTRGLARGGLAIVACRARTTHSRMVESDRREIVGIVTYFARRGRSNVARRFPGSHLPIVAPRALRRRCLKCGSEVAALAGDRPVLPGQREAGGHVIEFGDCLRPRNRWDKNQGDTKHRAGQRERELRKGSQFRPHGLRIPRFSGTHDEGTPRLQP